MTECLDYIGGAIVLTIIIVNIVWLIVDAILYVRDMILIEKAEKLKKKSETEDNNTE